ncbi:MAG: hypothetical protein KQH57_19970 [Actinomycetales bacterium]|nr:hypothetical protein [Actinomycetales bacterium]
MDLSYPSADFPGPPSLTVAVPDGWVRLDQADTVVAAVDPASPQGAATTFLVTVARVVGEQDLDGLVGRQVSVAAEGLGATVERQRREQVAGLDAVWSAFSLPARSDRPVSLFQAQTALLVPRRPRVRDLVTMVATCSADLAPRYGEVFREIFLSLALEV